MFSAFRFVTSATVLFTAATAICAGGCSSKFNFRAASPLAASDDASDARGDRIEHVVIVTDGMLMSAFASPVTGRGAAASGRSR